MNTHELGPTSPLTELISSWLEKEYNYVVDKFGQDQSGQLQAVSLSDLGNFGGQLEMSWGRILQARETDQSVRAAQAAAKLASGARSLWSTIRSMEWSSDAPTVQTSLELARQHIETDTYHSAKQFTDRKDFYETPIGLGVAYLELSAKRHGWCRSFRLSHLLRAQQIYQDAVGVMALQFDWTLGQVGNLPRPGQSSGNLEPWF